MQVWKSLFISEIKKNVIFTQWKGTVFSLVKNNMVVLFHSSLRITLVVFMVSLTDADPTFFVTPLLLITKMCLYNFDPFKPHFYVVKLGFKGIYIIFLISAQNIDRGCSLEPPCWGGSNGYPNLCFEQKYEKYQSFYLKFFSFCRWNFQYIWIGVKSHT